ncbi:hypothetical protein WYY_13765 [Bacillus velezensis M27]|nr:hypothetical protein KSO_013875 [Bacillus amyloliquefaciens IT-45]AKL75794.1 hypothetical protein ABH13_1199 [Bacillus velezensis]AMQ71713.1 hypothetical protein BAMY6639_17410 [Bacillus amyloliquefaciens UMAF6639]AMQ75655.1 hypothetical protein BAMY6614_09895 [Bacillus amyloliquefaciens UMAF6614]EJD67438.1 hypothetical protein BB65665_11395 [Bacillus sp. 916]EKE47355.1 hypothetical protein WYY_13765 [Bacillus velezensis M27]ERH52313.1 hypothetical protein O205_12980 [Bacillus amyloliquefa
MKPQQPVCFAAGRQSAKVLNPASDSHAWKIRGREKLLLLMKRGLFYF